MKIKIINPNTTWTMTEDISVAGKKFARPDTEVYAVSPSTGPESIESMMNIWQCLVFSLKLLKETGKNMQMRLLLPVLVIRVCWQPKR